MERYSRRAFLKITAALTGGAILETTLSQPARAALILGTELGAPEINSSLKYYLKAIQAAKTKFRKKVEEGDLFSLGKNFSLKNRLEDFDLYFPIYYAAQLEYNVPWPLLAIIHTDETTCSRDPDPGRWGCIGAMQRSPYHPTEQIYEASTNWQILQNLKQRYFGSPPRSIDYAEILWAARFINTTAQKNYPDFEPEAAMLSVVREKYSDPYFGRKRIDRYLWVKNFLEN
ncbi:MAG: hypothetical protein M1142_01440 [Patescibacteria group bacterium]|nr:hypothetical protein [Patescibacteria group bacterium]